MYRCYYVSICLQGYTPELLKEIHELSTYSAARQLHTLFKRLLDQKSIVARDFLTRADEIMIGNFKFYALDVQFSRFSYLSNVFDLFL